MRGFIHLKKFIDREEQLQVIDCVRLIAANAPFRTPRMVNGSPMNIKVTSCGAVGWWSSELRGYRYEKVHPSKGTPWPLVPAMLEDICKRALARVGLPEFRIDTCLINHYNADGSLGLHSDTTEYDQVTPIVSLSLGADAVFLLGGLERSDPQKKHLLQSGDVVIQSEDSRNFYHGIAELLPTIDNPMKDGGRLNLTFRKVFVE